MVRPALPCSIVFALLAAGARAQNLLVSRNSKGEQANAAIEAAVPSDDGTRFALATRADNFAENADHNGKSDVYYRDLATGRTIRVSQESDGNDANGESGGAGISGDGRFVVFYTAANDILPNDVNVAQDVVVYVVETGAVEDVSVNTSGKAGNDHSFDPAISHDGNFVAFTSLATNFGRDSNKDTNGFSDVFLRDRAAGTTVRVSVAADGGQANGPSYDVSISADGRYVAFTSEAGNLVPGADNGEANVYVKDVQTGAIELASVAFDGSLPFGAGCVAGRIAAGGGAVAFLSAAENLVPGRAPGTLQVYVRDLVAHTTELASAGPGGAFPDEECTEHCISGDGRFVFFVSNADDLVAATNGSWQLFVRDRVLGVTMVAVYDRFDAFPGSAAILPNVTADGGFLTFLSGAAELTDDDTLPYSFDAFLRTRRLDVAATANFGAGWPGTFGVPSLAGSPPAFGQRVTLSAANSSALWSVGLVLVGSQAADLPTGWGGELLLLPSFVAAVAIPPAGVAFSGVVPADERLAGVSWFAQVLEQDAGASDGVSFTPALQLTFGF